MLVRLKLKIEAYHIPSGTWHIHETKHGVRAVSPRHALTKGLQRAMSLPCYKDREGSPDWQVSAEVGVSAQ
jgi:hypothetical protein